MTDADTGPRVISVKWRIGNQALEIGRCQRGTFGWRFFPMTTAHAISRKIWPTWESCIPRWAGYPNRCETEVIR